MTTIEKYDQIIAQFKNAINDRNVDRCKELDAQLMHEVMLPYCMEAPRAVVEVETVLDNKEIEDGLVNCKPIIRKLHNRNDGYLVILHGSPFGRFIIDPKTEVRIDDNRFTDLFPPGANVLVVSCYPGSRPFEWSHNGRHFKNLAHEAGCVPLTFGTTDNKVYIREVSISHRELIYFDLPKVADLV